MSENAPSGSKDDGKVQVEGLDWDLEERSQKSERSNKSAISFGSNQIISISPLHKPIESRDLMVLACELFQPYSKHFKVFFKRIFCSKITHQKAIYARCKERYSLRMHSFCPLTEYLISLNEDDDLCKMSRNFLFKERDE